ncbi:uncharacterized protein LOC113490583 [Athene cunicularia]|uniref:uncharacterized protein LOC113490583 n=1 Tax=Athene cunicularia TaxID=194338 RepID=UPI000EF652A8|nr:uncharacterized protein LOC113490583 [Athene cunicularia]
MLPIVAVPGWAASLVHSKGPPVPGRMGQANGCCGSRDALADAEPVLSADVQLTWGCKRSERHLLLLQDELRWHHPAPTAPPGPGPAVGAERREGDGMGGSGGWCRQPREELPPLPLAQGLLHCRFRLPGAEGALVAQIAGDTQWKQEAPSDPRPVTQAPGEGAELPPCLQAAQHQEPGEAGGDPVRG